MKLPRIPHSVFLFLPLGLMVLGASLNQLALISNGGTMPVLFPGWTCPDLGEDTIHRCMTQASHLKFLCDVFNFHTTIESIGDQFLELGSLLMGPAFITWCVLMIKDRN